MESTILLGGLIAAVLGAVVGQWKFRNAFAGALVGALIGLVGVWLFGNKPGAVMAVETTGDFQSDVLDHDTPVLVDFYADWCPPCRRLAPTIDKLGKEYAGRIRVVKINVDKGGAIAAAYHVRAIPTVILFVNGQPAHRWRGPKPGATYRAVLNRFAPPD